MPNYQLSGSARLDLFEIADYTVDTRGPEQANRYLESLVNCFELLAKTPSIGRSREKIRPGYRRMEHQKHAIFYRFEAQTVLIVRILHQGRMPNLQAFEED